MPYKFTDGKASHMKNGKKKFLPKKQALAILLSKKKKGKKDENDSYLKPGMKDEKE